MSPGLARALSQALEEELDEELAQVMEPILSRLKARIPAIIERCRTTLATQAIDTIDDANTMPIPCSSERPCVASEVADLRKGSDATIQYPLDRSNAYLQPVVTVSEVKRRRPQYSPVPQLTPSASREGSEETSNASASASTENIAHINTMGIPQYPEHSANITDVGESAWDMYNSLPDLMQPAPDTTMLEFGLLPSCQGLEEQNPVLDQYHDDPYSAGGSTFHNNDIPNWSNSATINKRGWERYPAMSEQLLGEEDILVQSTHWQVPPHSHLPYRGPGC